jgi:hypothetical protein
LAKAAQQQAQSQYNMFFEVRPSQGSSRAFTCLGPIKIAAQNFTCQTSPKPYSQLIQVAKTALKRTLKNVTI